MAGSEVVAQTQEPAQLNCRIEPSVMVEMSSAVEGVISEVLVEKNDIIKKGDVVARLDAGLEAATVELRRVQAELTSDVQAQRLALEFSNRALIRVKDLYEKKAASFSELDSVGQSFSFDNGGQPYTINQVSIQLKFEAGASPCN